MVRHVYSKKAVIRTLAGMTSDVKVEGMLPIGYADIIAGDGVVVLSGFMAGKSFTVDRTSCYRSQQID